MVVDPIEKTHAALAALRTTLLPIDTGITDCLLLALYNRTLRLASLRVRNFIYNRISLPVPGSYRMNYGSLY